MKKLAKYFLTILFIIASLSYIAPAFAATTAMVYDGIKRGDVTTRMTASGTDVAIEEAITAMGYARTAENQGVVVTLDGQKMEIWNKSNVVRVSGQLVPLASPAEFTDGHWWIDKAAAERIMNIFNSSVNQSGKLRFTTEEIVSNSVNPAVKAVPQQKKETVKADPQPKIQLPEVKIPAAAQPVTATAAVTQEAELPDPAVNSEYVKREFKNKRPVVVIDAGHGAHDPGASGHGIREKDINLKAALELGNILARYGADVRYTRKTDVFLKLQERTAFANKNNADLFISLHCNSLPKPTETARGVEIYLMASPRDKDSLRLAIEENKDVSGGIDSVAALQNADRKTKLLLKILGDMQQTNKISESTQFVEELNSAIKKNRLQMRKVSQAPFFVLRGAGMPAVLIEMGYLTSATDAARLNTATYRRQLMLGVAQGAVSYIKKQMKM